MKRFTDAGRRALAADNLYAGLSLALTMPDICASLEDPGPGKSKARYIRWAKQWLEPRFTHEVGAERKPFVFISAEDFYQVRCSLIHSGQSHFDDKSGSFKFEFVDASIGAHLNRFDRMVINGKEVGGFLQLRVDRFSNELFDAADAWDTAVASLPAVQAEKAKLIVIRSAGFTIGGGAIKFG